MGFSLGIARALETEAVLSHVATADTAGRRDVVGVISVVAVVIGNNDDEGRGGGSGEKEVSMLLLPL